MQENKYDEFDLQIRSLMEDAGESVPSGVWESVSARLDAIGAAAPAASAGASGVRSRRGWYWAAAPLAAAAAVALGIFFTGTSDNSDLINIVASDALVSEQISVEDNSNRNTIQSPDTRSFTLRSSTNVEAPVSSSAHAVSAPAEKPSAAASQADSQVPEEVADTRKDDAPHADPFAMMAFEDSHSAKVPGRRVSAVFGGSINSNNASQGTGARGSGGSYPQNDITEISKSDFGIPLTLGLGMRFHINDRLAIGTGVDYSLLVRTFDGIYSGGGSAVSGDIRHTIQYVGIPLDVFYTIINSHDIRFYVNGGIEAEYAVSDKYSIRSIGKTVSGKVDGLQWSAGTGLGVEFALGNWGGLFVEPSARYYFNCDQPKSIRTDKPFQLVLRAGLRFDL